MITHELFYYEKFVYLERYVRDWRCLPHKLAVLNGRRGAFPLGTLRTRQMDRWFAQSSI